MVSTVSSPGCGTMYASRPPRGGRDACCRALVITAEAAIVLGGRSAIVQRPSRSIRIGTGS